MASALPIALDDGMSHEFVHVEPPAFSIPTYEPTVFETFTEHTSATRVFTDSVIAASIRAKYPDLSVTITTASTCDLLRFARSGNASALPYGDPDEMLFERSFLPPMRRHDQGSFVENVQFARFKYEYEGATFLLYIVDCRDGTSSYPSFKMNYILTGKSDRNAKETDKLIEAATRWGLTTHEQVLVFDGGYWRADADLYKAIKKSHWKDVILEEDRKQAVIDDVASFFNGEANYAEFAVPWKRGLIFWGPPGNGKTISIKALMNDLTERKDPTVELLYVKSLRSMGGPEQSIRLIFQKARAMAPCFLIFEDLDSLVTDAVRSYFLNEVDGLESNHGILMVGSTNHLERLDPGIAKRPSRFDRKYLFPLPSRDERIQYCEYWRNKLKDNPKIDFPKVLSEKIAEITDDFSFAYLKEAFVASLLAIVGRQKKVEAAVEDEGGDELEKSLLWKEIRKQIQNLRDEMGNEARDADAKKLTLATRVPERPRTSRERYMSSAYGDRTGLGSLRNAGI